MDIEKFREIIMQSVNSQNLLIFQETIGIEKLKNTWIAQIVTIAGTLLGGLTLFSPEKNIVASIGLVILFGTIVFGLVLIIRNLNKESNRLTATFGQFNDLSFRVILLTFYEQEPSLTPEQQLQKQKLEQEVRELTTELGVTEKDGNLGSLSKNLKSDKISVGNYILIVGLSVGGLLITLSEQLLGWVKC